MHDIEQVYNSKQMRNIEQVYNIEQARNYIFNQLRRLCNLLREVTTPSCYI